MMTALVGSSVVNASKGLKGKEFTYRCRNPKCKGELILVCSDRYLAGQKHNVRTVHFRHLHKCACSYCSGEGAWHREWKSHFERVEVRYPDFANGELNIADAVVGENFVLEFQHYHIALAEAEAREAAYGPNGGMMWIIDANRRNALAKLRRAGSDVLEPTKLKNAPDHFEIACPGVLFPEEWVSRPVAVVFDYGPGFPLLRLYPGRTPAGRALVQKIEKGRLIEELKRDPAPFGESAADVYGRELVKWNDLLATYRKVSAYNASRQAAQAGPRTRITLMPTNTPHFYRGSDGVLYCDYFGSPMPYTRKYAAALALAEKRKCYRSRRRRWRL